MRFVEDEMDKYRLCEDVQPGGLGYHCTEPDGHTGPHCANQNSTDLAGVECLATWGEVKPFFDDAELRQAPDGIYQRALKKNQWVVAKIGGKFYWIRHPEYGFMTPVRPQHRFSIYMRVNPDDQPTETTHDAAND
jgi:hypothetical protein